MKRSTKSIITFILALAMVVTLIPASVSAKAKTYHAYMCIQTDTSWVFRDDYGNAKTGHGTKYFKQLSMSKDNKFVKKDGKFTDVTMKKNGTYTVKLTNPDFNGDKHISVLALSTDIPLTKKGVKITNIKAKFDGTTKKTFAKAYYDPNEKKYYKPLLLNSWNPQVKDCFAYRLPAKKIEITFTIKGL